MRQASSDPPSAGRAPRAALRTALLPALLIQSLWVAACGARRASSAPAAPDAEAQGAMEGGASADASADAAVVPCPPVSTFAASSGATLAVANDTPALGIFDPSLLYPEDAGVGFMAYSAVPNQGTIATHVASSVDHGSTWSFVVQVNSPQAATVPSSSATDCPGGSCSGNFVSEVPSLVADESDPDPSRAYKMFTHRYLVGADFTLHYTIGTIALQTAPDPSGPWSAPQKLLGWTSESPYSSSGVVTDVSALPGLSDCAALTEPGALVRGGVIDLAVGCVYPGGSGFTTRVELLRSTTHAASWQRVGTLLGAKDSACLAGTTGMNAADLFVSGGVEYVSATPSTDGGQYVGCLVFRVPDPALADVERDDAGQGIVVRSIAPSPAQFAGACTFADGAGGYLLDVGFLTQLSDRFRILTPLIPRP
jgi:hypothetical protein